MRYYALILCVLVALVASACNLNSSDDNDAEPITTATTDATGSPTLTINSPSDGDEVVVNDEVLVSVTATDSVGVTRIQLIADGRTVQTVTSESATGDPSRNALLAYTPRSTGDLTLRVIAYRGSVSSDAEEITLNVRSSLSQVTATSSGGNNVPVIDPNDPTCRALINTNLNFRRGPSTDFGVIRVLGAGELLPVVGRVQNNSWLQLNSGGTSGWVASQFVTTYGSLCRNVSVVITPTPQTQPTAVPTITPLPTNTPIPTSTPIPSRPNLDVPNIGGERNLQLGADGTVSQQYGVTIRNRGGAINQQFANIVRVSPGDVEYDLGVVAGLGQNESINLTITLTFDQPGIYTVRVITDSDNQITEDSETDNIAIIEVSVTE